MCGGSLDVSDGKTVVECDYCGTKQTLPRSADENIQSLFNRANMLRMKNEFDKAEAIYEKILLADEREAEAYWGLILCKFGIEYVEDPKTYKRLPTCHRTSFESVTADEYYKKALEYSDVVSRSVYEEEAKRIDEIQKDILAISAREEPYDVFICYKESDDSGKRTPDSVIANDIYYQLSAEGFKVFYAAITLEDKLGSAYEPIIFSALNSAKVMLAIGTKPEYFEAVWVKNEWKRFLKMMKNDRSKMLIPCYKGMDAYDLPEDFSHLQAQDMGKIGFINDIVRGIKKVIVKDEPKATVIKETVAASSDPSVEPLLKRAFMFLEDMMWEQATEYCERVLDQDPENARAYLGKLMADLKVTEPKKLNDQAKPFDDNYNYKRAIRFADEALKKELEGYNEHITKERQRIEADHKAALEKSLIRGSQNYISAGANHTVAIKADGTVVAVGKNGFGQCEVSDWSDIIAVSVGYAHTVGLKADGTVVAVGDNYYGQCDVSSWSDIVAVSAEHDNTIGLKADGTVIAVGWNEYGQCEVSDWSGIVAISAGCSHTVGLKADGTVVAVGKNDYEQCDVSKWSDIVAISAGSFHTVGLKADGTVIAVGIKDDGRCDVSGWSDIVAVSAGGLHTVGLKADGTVFAVGKNDNGQCDISDWSDIVAISAGDEHTAGLKADGTVVAVGDNACGRCNVSDWTDIDVPILAETKAEFDMKYAAHREDVKRKAAAQRASYIAAGLCAHCGGAFKGLFSKKCADCGKAKDY